METDRIFSRITDVRGELFGFSILSIMVFHFFEDTEAAGAGAVLTALTKAYNLALGSCGVDIFLFLSGMGLFYSLSRCSVPRFYRRRLSRVLPAYLLLGGAGWLTLDILLRQAGVPRFLFDFSTLSFWTEGVRLVWYIALLVPLYLVFPLLYRLLTLADRRLSDALTVLLTAAVIAGCLALRVLSPAVYEHLEIALWRVVSFILGAWYGRKSLRGEGFGREGAVLCVLGAVFTLLMAATRLHPGLLWGVFALRCGSLFYPFLVLTAATALLWRVRHTRFCRVLRCCGAASLELYLSHVMLRAIFNRLGLSTAFLPVYLLCLAASFALSAAVHRLLTRRKPKLTDRR